MKKEEYIQKRIKGRKQLLEKIVETFKTLDPVSIYQFGSGTEGFKDEFSDIDVWIVFRDKDIEKTLSELSRVFCSISPVLIKHHSKTWSPVGGSSNSIIHEVNGDLFVVDYYISKASETVLKKDSKIMYGSDTFKKGEWRLNRHVDEKIKETHTLRKDVDLFLDLIFISFKGIFRKWEDDSFVNTLKTIHRNFREHYQEKIPDRRLGLSFKSNYRLLSDLYRISNKRQKRAISKIRSYGHKIEELYF